MFSPSAKLYPPSLDIIPSLVDDSDIYLNDIFSQKFIAGDHQFPFNLLNTDKLIKPIKHLNEVISPPTSDDESYHNNLVTFSEICNGIFDKKMLRLVEGPKDLPQNALPGIVFSNIKSGVTAQNMKDILQNNQNRISPCEIRIFSHEDEGIKTYYALCKFENIFQCEYIYKSKNEYSHKMQYCYDATDMSNSNWFCVVIRNIPYSRKDDFIDIYCKDFIDQIDHPISMIKISSVLCFGIVMNSLEAAEKLCKALNGKDGMKAHLHNKTCKKGNRKSNKKLMLNGSGKTAPKKKRISIIQALLQGEKILEKRNKA